MERKQIVIGNQRLNYYYGGEGQPLLILHGWGASSQTMLTLAQKMALSRTCFVPDLPGFGNSPVPDSAWNVADYAQCVKSFIESEIGQPCDVLVHSFGGRILLKLLDSEWSKTWIKKVIITGGAGMKPRRTWKYYYRFYASKMAKAPFMILPEALKQKGLDALRKTAFWKSLGSSDYSSLTGIMRAIFVKVVSEYLEKHLSGITHEVLLLWGKNDDSTPLYQAERMQKGIRNATLIPIEQAGHYAFLDQPTTFYAIANAYLNPEKK